MTQLRQRMSEDMQVRNFALNTQLSYLQQVSLFSRYFSKSPDLLGRQHLAEDCRMLPSASDWVTGFDPPGWLPCMVPLIEDLVDDDVRRHGGEATIYRELHRWFYDTKVWADGPAWFLFRHHAFGVFEAEERFGPVLRVRTRAVQNLALRANGS